MGLQLPVAPKRPQDADRVKVPIQLLPHAGDLALPAYTTAGAAGVDLRAAVPADVSLAPLERVLVPTGIAIAIPTGWEAQIRPRSGWAADTGVTVLNAPGTVDSDYRGEIKVLLVNFGSASVQVHRGDRIAQLVFSPVTSIEWEQATSLPSSARQLGGFGHTGRT